MHPNETIDLANEKKMPNKEDERSRVGRREWLRGVLRAMSCGALALLAGVLTMRRSQLPTQNCAPRNLCGQCRKLPICDEPRAVDAKRDRRVR